VGAVIGYRDFDLALERADGGYWARVFTSPAGEGTAPFEIPFGEPELKGLLEELRAAASASPGPGWGRQSGLDRIRGFGGGLFDAVFREVVGDLLRASLAETTRETCTAWRRRIRACAGATTSSPLSFPGSSRFPGTALTIRRSWAGCGPWPIPLEATASH
jgi:hypothetical protein